MALDDFWQSLIAGTVGGVVTGSFALGGIYLTVRHQGAESRRQRRAGRYLLMRDACRELALAIDSLFVPLAMIENALRNDRRPASDVTASFDEAMTRFRAARVALVLEADPAVRDIVNVTNRIIDAMLDGILWLPFDGARLNQGDQGRGLAAVEVIKQECQTVADKTREYLAGYNPDGSYADGV